MYDASIGSFSGWEFIGLGVLFSIIGAGLVFSTRVRSVFSQNSTEKFYRIFSRFFFGFSIFWSLLVCSFVWLGNSSAKRASIKNTCSIAEGQVKEFEPMPRSGHQLEKFKVDNVSFGYSDYVVTGGFNNTASHGGPIKEGLQVRICYLSRNRTNSNIIVRLEIAI